MKAVVPIMAHVRSASQQSETAGLKHPVAGKDGFSFLLHQLALLHSQH